MHGETYLQFGDYSISVPDTRYEMIAKSHSNLGSNTVSAGAYRSGSGRPVPQGTLEAVKPVIAAFIGHGLDPE